MKIVQQYARRKRIAMFMPCISPNDRVLEIGSADGWFGDMVKRLPVKEYVSLDLVPPADIVGDIKNWRQLGLARHSFDKIIAFEVLEHVDCLQELSELLKPEGRLLVTTPVPHMDWVLKIIEGLGLGQKRTSPHSNLIYLRRIPYFEIEKMSCPCGLGQWAVLKKCSEAAK